MMNMNQLGMQMPGMGMQGLNPMSAMQGNACKRADSASAAPGLVDLSAVLVRSSHLGVVIGCGQA